MHAQIVLLDQFCCFLEILVYWSSKICFLVQKDVPDFVQGYVPDLFCILWDAELVQAISARNLSYN
jgi:hypothetical protein